MQNSLKRKGFTHESAYNESRRLDTLRLEFVHFRTLKPFSKGVSEKILGRPNPFFLPKLPENPFWVQGRGWLLVGGYVLHKFSLTGK